MRERDRIHIPGRVEHETNVIGELRKTLVSRQRGVGEGSGSSLSTEEGRGSSLSAKEQAGELPEGFYWVPKFWNDPEALRRETERIEATLRTQRARLRRKQWLRARNQQLPNMFALLPLELTEHIFSWLEPNELRPLEGVCRAWRGILQEDSFWRAYFRAKYGTPRSQMSWREKCLRISNHVAHFGQAKGHLLNWGILHGYSKVVDNIVQSLEDCRVLNQARGAFVGCSPLLIAAEEGHQAVVDLLLKRRGIDPDVRDLDGDTPLITAAALGHVAVVRTLLAHGANVNAVSESGRTAMLLAAWHGQTQVVGLLLRAGANPGAAGEGEATPLHCAAEQGHPQVIRLLLEQGAPVDPQRADGATPLLMAAQAGHAAAVAQLLRNRPAPDLQHSIDIESCRGTPLALAVQGGHVEVVQLLLAAGVDGSPAANCGEDLVLVAQRQGRSGIARMLRHARMMSHRWREMQDDQMRLDAMESIKT